MSSADDGVYLSTVDELRAGTVGSDAIGLESGHAAVYDEVDFVPVLWRGLRAWEEEANSEN